MVAAWLAKAGLKRKGCCHMLRHTCATHMLENGADIRFIQQLLGHEKLDTTAIYTEVSIKQLAGGSRPLPPRGEAVPRPGSGSGTARKSGFPSARKGVVLPGGANLPEPPDFFSCRPVRSRRRLAAPGTPGLAAKNSRRGFALSAAGVSVHGGGEKPLEWQRVARDASAKAHRVSNMASRPTRTACSTCGRDITIHIFRDF